MNIVEVIIVAVGAAIIARTMMFIITELVMTEDVQIDLAMTIFLLKRKKLRSVVVAAGPTNINVLATGDRGNG